MWLYSEMKLATPANSSVLYSISILTPVNPPCWELLSISVEVEYSRDLLSPPSLQLRLGYVTRVLPTGGQGRSTKGLLGQDLLPDTGGGIVLWSFCLWTQLFKADWKATCNLAYEQQTNKIILELSCPLENDLLFITLKYIQISPLFHLLFQIYSSHSVLFLLPKNPLSSLPSRSLSIPKGPTFTCLS